MLTVKTLSPDNRTKRIGNSLYRIASNNYLSRETTIWYVGEIYNNPETKEFIMGKGYWSRDLQKVIDYFNSITAEKEIVSEVISNWL